MGVRGLIGCALAALCAGQLVAAPAATEAPSFPRFLGINIGAKNYGDPRYQRELARLDIAILGFYKGWGAGGDSAAAMRVAVQAIKAHNPRILLGQYTVLNEAYDDPRDIATRDLKDKLDASGWWLQSAAGRRVQWTSRYASWEVNLTQWAAPDELGRRWPEWLAERNAKAFFRDVPELDIVYIDNVMARPRVRGDWDRDGRDDDPGSARILAQHHAGHLAYWKRLRALVPSALLIGNVDGDLANPEWRGQLDGAILEALMGESWSIEAREGWPAMMARYRAALRHTRAPAIVGFNVTGDARDYRALRYAYASCLLDDGYFSFTDRARGHAGVAWFDEFDLRLGRALGPPPSAPWSGGVWRRDFEHGVALVNPQARAQSVDLEPGLRRLAGRQDPATNNAGVAGTLVLRPRDGIILRREAPTERALRDPARRS